MDDRRDDWRAGVDENLMSLTSAQRVTDRQLDDLDLKYIAVDKILRGDPEEGTDGLVARQHAAENAQQELRGELDSIKRDLYGDHAGGDGIAKRVERLVEGDERKDKWWARIFEFGGRLLIELLILGTALLLNWDRVADFLHRRFSLEPPAHTQTKKRTRQRKPIVMPEVDGDSAAEKVP